VLLIHEAGPSREEVAEAVRPAPHVAADEPGLKVVVTTLRRISSAVGSLCSTAKYARSAARTSLSDGRSPTPGGVHHPTGGTAGHSLARSALGRSHRLDLIRSVVSAAPAARRSQVGRAASAAPSHRSRFVHKGDDQELKQGEPGNAAYLV
jgi:hypothetical protein